MAVITTSKNRKAGPNHPALRSGAFIHENLKRGIIF
jgi:hypothetical protein